MPNLSGTELIIILIIVLLLFGVGRVGKIGGELGRAIREFRRGLSGDDDQGNKAKQEAAKSDTPKNDQAP